MFYLVICLFGKASFASTVETLKHILSIEAKNWQFPHQEGEPISLLPASSLLFNERPFAHFPLLSAPVFLYVYLTSLLFPFFFFLRPWVYTVKRDKGGISHSGKKRELRTSPEKKLRLFAENIAGQKVHALFAVSDRKRSPATIPKVGRFDLQKELVERSGEMG